MKRSVPQRLATVLFVAGATLVPGVAHAQSDSAAVAEALFQQARDLYKQEHYTDACPKFAESQRLDPKLGTLLNLAVCNQKLGKVATAWAEYTSAAVIAHRDGQKEREDFAREQIAVLEAKLPRVILQVNAPEPRLTITWDEQSMASAVLGTPLPVDPGKHRIAASAPGKKPWSQEIKVPAEKGEVLVAIPALEAAELVIPPPTPPPAPALTTTPPPAPPLPVAPPPAPAGNEAMIAVYTGFGIGGLGVVVGTVTGILTLSKASSIRSGCTLGMPPTGCPTNDAGSISATGTLANASNVSFALGAAGLAVGVVGLILRPRDAPRATGGLEVTPTVGPGFVGASGRF